MVFKGNDGLQLKMMLNTRKDPGSRLYALKNERHELYFPVRLELGTCEICEFSHNFANKQYFIHLRTQDFEAL